jgi:hypothetical protein
MGKKGYFVSLILLVLFGVNILAEAASNHIEPINQHSTVSTQSSEAQITSLHSTTDCPDRQHPSDSSNNCADPCHTGRCHFGHCYHMVKGYSAFDPSVSMQSHLTYELLVPKAPFLEGPKRPPRHS